MKHTFKTEIDKRIDSLLATRSNKWDNRITFTPKEISEMLGLPRSTITKLYQEGELKVCKTGRHYLITRLALFDFLSRIEDNGILL